MHVSLVTCCAPYLILNIFHSKIGQQGTKSLWILLQGKLSKSKFAKLVICCRLSVVETFAWDLQLTLFYLIYALLASMKYPYFIVCFHPQGCKPDAMQVMVTSSLCVIVFYYSIQNTHTECNFHYAEQTVSSYFVTYHFGVVECQH